MYNPLNWYWEVPSRNNEVWSSKRRQWVPKTDTDFRNFSYDPTRIASEQDLWDVLLEQNPDGLPLNNVNFLKLHKARVIEEREKRQIKLLEAASMDLIANREHLNEIIRTTSTRLLVIVDKKAAGQTLTQEEIATETLARNTFAVFETLISDSLRLEKNPLLDYTDDNNWTFFRS